MKILIAILTLSFMFGCALPTTTVRSVDSRPSLAIKGASSSALLVIDGLTIGKADEYNGDPQTVKIEPGTHRVSIIENGAIVYNQDIFVESELKTITVR